MTDRRWSGPFQRRLDVCLPKTVPTLLVCPPGALTINQTGVSIFHGQPVFFIFASPRLPPLNMTANLIEQAIEHRIQNWCSDESNASCQITFDADFIGFAGHFPGNPLVPGVCLTAIGAVMSRRLLGEQFRIVAMPRLKFSAMVRPGDTLECLLKVIGDDSLKKATFSATLQGTPACRCRLDLKREEL